MNLTVALATGNSDKAKEFQRILEPLGLTIVMPKDLGIVFDVDETGTTFADNAKLKSIELYQQTGLITIADDSGLCIDALDGRPGVYSARYGGENSSYEEKFRLLYEELNDIPEEQWTASFVCSICCVIDNNTLIEINEDCKGIIGKEPKGEKGFGYDPIFFVGDRSFAEFSAEEKDEFSHRGKALRAFYKEINQYFQSKGDK